MHGNVSRRIIARTVAAKLLAEPSRTKHWVKVLAAYLVEQSMADEVNLIVNDIAGELYEQSGHLLVDVTSAHKLTESVRQELKRLLTNLTDAKRVEFVEHIDPALLGGLVARTPSAIIDTSVRTKLKQLATI